ncbi:MAG: DUF504 domain-containing protein [Thermodesulfobacteriota bacterium]
MIPIHQLLARIRFDRDFGRGDFAIGYLDHDREGLVRLPLKNVVFTGGNRFALEVLLSDGTRIGLPMHRIHAVWKDGELIWRRPDPVGGGGDGH